jgi:hypothetical protein
MVDPDGVTEKTKKLERVFVLEIVFFYLNNIITEFDTIINISVIFTLYKKI